MITTPTPPEKKHARISLSARLTAGVVLLAMLLTIAVCMLDYKVLSDNTQRFYTDKVVTAVMNSSAVINGDYINDIVETGTYPDEFKNTLRVLDAIKQNTGLKYLYVFTLGDDGITYVYTAYREGDSEGDMLAPGTFESYEDLGGDKIFRQTVETRAVSSSLAFEQSGNWGYVASSFAPIFDSNGDVVALVGADYSMTAIMAEIGSNVLRLALTIAVIVALLVLLFYFALRRTLIQPLNGLTKSALTFVSGNDHESGIRFAKLPLVRNDEISDLNDAFAQMSDDLNAYLSELTLVTSEKEKIQAELSVAKRIQAMFLPRIFPPFVQCDKMMVYATMDPAKDVGGDFYDFFMIDKQRFCFTIADVSGKGVPAALFMVIAKTIMKNLALTGISTGEIITAANEQLASNNDENMFVTTFLGIINLETNELVYTNAGHNAPLICQPNGSFEFLKSKRQLVVGAMNGIKYRESSIMLQHGARMFLYTDGVSEAMNEAAELYGDARLFSDLNDTCANDDVPLNDQMARFTERLKAFVGHADQSDDITMMLLKYSDIQHATNV